jgi:hypothetical protein
MPEILLLALPTVLTTVGAGRLAGYFSKVVALPADFFIGWGTGTGGAVVGNTVLGTPSAEARVASTLSQPGPAQTTRFVSTIVSASTQTISEIGVFDASTSGNMLIRGNFTGIGVELNDSIEFTVNAEFKDSSVI